MELIDRGFAQKIADKYTNLQLFTSDFAPITSTKRIIPRMKWLELVYAMPYLVLRREILNSFKRTKNVFASAKQIFFIHLDFPPSSYEYITTRLDRFSRESRGFYFKSSSMELTQPLSHETSRIETESTFTNYQLPVVPHQPPLVSHETFTVSNKNLETYVLTGASEFITPLFSYYSKLPLTKLAQTVSPETAKVETEKELAVTNYQLPVVTHLLPTLSHKPASVGNKSIERTSILPGAKEFMNNKQTHLNTLGVEKAPLYHTYPEIEHVTSTHTEIIKERVIEKEEESKPPRVTPQLPSIDMNRLADQVYSFIERKIRIEKERRGIYG